MRDLAQELKRYIVYKAFEKKPDFICRISMHHTLDEARANVAKDKKRDTTLGGLIARNDGMGKVTYHIMEADWAQLEVL